MHLTVFPIPQPIFTPWCLLLIMHLNFHMQLSVYPNSVNGLFWFNQWPETLLCPLTFHILYHTHPDINFYWITPTPVTYPQQLIDSDDTILLLTFHYTCQLTPMWREVLTAMICVTVFWIVTLCSEDGGSMVLQNTGILPYPDPSVVFMFKCTCVWPTQ